MRAAPEVKAQALADLLDGDQPAVVAARYGLPSGTVRQWKARLVTPDVTQSVTPAVTKVPIRQPSIERAQLDIAELIMENLRAKLIATQGIVDYVAHNPAWLEKQNAADVGALFTEIDRSAIAILDRMAAAGRRGDDDGTGVA